MRPIRQLLAVVVAATAVLFSAALFSAAPAFAHDVAESTSPANGSTVASVPDSVSITFNNRPLLLGSQIRVNDASGQNWADGSVEIVDAVVSQKLRPGAPAGVFTVIWRVVSSDSHPIEGTFTFTAKAGSTTAGSGSASTAPSVEVPTAGTAAPGSTDDAGEGARCLPAVPLEHCGLRGGGRGPAGLPGHHGTAPAGRRGFRGC